jgi:hypothetical protein
LRCEMSAFDPKRTLSDRGVCGALLMVLIGTLAISLPLASSTKTTQLDNIFLPASAAGLVALSCRRKHGAAEGEEIYRGVDGMRVLPLDAKGFPIFRLHGPILCRGVRWLSEEHKDN